MVIRRKTPRTRLQPLLHGGGHERGYRPGTLNVPGIVGLGAACEIAAAEMDVEAARLRSLRDQLWAGIRREIEDVFLNGTMEARLPNNLNVSFAGVEGESLIMSLRDVVAVSSGSACSSAKVEASHVLRAMGVSKELAHSSIRFGLGRGNTAGQIDEVKGKLAESVKRLRSLRLA
jgi:cysteine desulfurase